MPRKHGGTMANMLINLTTQSVKHAVLPFTMAELQQTRRSNLTARSLKHATSSSPLFEPCHANMAANRAFQPIQPDMTAHFETCPAKNGDLRRFHPAPGAPGCSEWKRKRKSRPTAPNWLQSPEQEVFCPLPWALLMNSKDSTNAASQDDQ